MEDELSDLTTCLDQSLESVTQLTIQLKGRDTGKVDNDIVNLAAAAVRILGPFCGPLTHITVCGEVVLEKIKCFGASPIFTFTPLVQAAGSVCPSSLTHLRFSMLLRAGWGTPASLGKAQCQNFVPDGAFCIQLDDGASEALASLTHLTHLWLEHGDVSDNTLWDFLPSSLQSLGMHTLLSHRSAPQTLKPNLRELTLKFSSCSQLLKLMAMCPQLTGLDLATLQMPCSPEELADLGDIMSHPAWCANNSSGQKCTPVTELLQATEWEVLDPEASAAILAALPVMPTITKFVYEYMDTPGQTPPPNSANLLHHITRAFPYLKTLRISDVPFLDSKGQDTSRVQKPSITAAAAAVHILGPLCGSLTHITVTGEVRTNGGEQTYTLFLNAASTVASQTLTHLSFRIRAMGHRLGHEIIRDEKLWAALPQSLLSLDLCSPHEAPPEGVTLPKLLRLTMEAS
ncbi:MAG: hypothetical protein WDW38_009700 [Sanguina aurantia]